MVVTALTASRVGYKHGIDAYLTNRKYADVKALVAFGGTVVDNGVDDTEAAINCSGEGGPPAKFTSDEYGLLIVAEKYQTGFDQLFTTGEQR
jgi:type I restriction enzyme, R subunit